MLLSVHIKREGESPVVSPLSSEDAHHSDRYQVTFIDTHTHQSMDNVCAFIQMTLNSTNKNIYLTVYIYIYIHS